MTQPAQSAAREDVPVWVRWVVQLTRHLWNPVVLLRKSPTPIGEQLVPLSADDIQRLPDGMRERLATSEHALTSLDFSPPFRGTNTVLQNVRSCFSLLEHPKDGALAFILVTHGAHVGTSTVVSFRTDFADAQQLYTSNSRTIPRTPSRPLIEGVRFPRIEDPKSLYDIHRFSVAERSRKSAVVPLTRGNDPLAFQAQEAQGVHEFWVRAGYYELVEGPALRFTTKGAVLASWRGLFPWKQYTTWRNTLAANAILSKLGKR